MLKEFYAKLFQSDIDEVENNFILHVTMA